MFSNNINDQILLAKIDLAEYIENFKIENLNLCINISNICNLKCDYCFNNEKKDESTDIEKIKLIINDFVYRYSDCEKIYVDLSGKGEPLLKLSLIYQINDFCKDLSNRIFKEILVSFVTNGVLLTPNIAESLQEKGILFGVSLDGNKENHDMYRKDVKGNGTYDLILGNIKKIKNRKYIGCAVTLTNNVFSLVESLKELTKFFNTISYKPVRDNKLGFNRNNIGKWLKEYQKLTLFLCEKTSENDLKFIKTLLNGEDYFGKFIYRCLMNSRTLNRCDAGISRFAINSDGEIYDCPAQSMSYNKKTEIQPIENLKNQIHRLKNHCSYCKFKLICGGECTVVWNSKKKNDKIMCKFKEQLIKYALYIVYKLRYCYDEKIYTELIDFCKEKNNRNYMDEELKEFLLSNPHYSFNEGKKIFDEIKNRY